MIERTIVIGDIHACYTEFKEMLELIDYKNPAVRVILLGDLFDRGPESRAVVKLARELKLESVSGNHSQKFLKWLSGPRHYPGHTYKHYLQFSPEDIAYIQTMPLYIELPTAIVVHAGLLPGVALSAQTKDTLCYLRYTDKDRNFISLKKLNKFGKEALGAMFWTEFGPFGKSVIYGHEVWDKPKIDRFDDDSMCVGIDTGCCFGNALTSFSIETEEFIQVKAKEEYYKSDFHIR